MLTTSIIFSSVDVNSVLEVSVTSSFPPYLELVHKLTNYGGKTVSKDPLSSSILLFVRLIKASRPELYSSKVFTSGGKELILGRTLKSGRNTVLTILANLSLMRRKA